MLFDSVFSMASRVLILAGPVDLPIRPDNMDDLTRYTSSDVNEDSHERLDIFALVCLVRFLCNPFILL